MTARARKVGRAGGAMVAVMLGATGIGAHGGPPFPIVSNQVAGAYEVSVWTDPDATDDGSAAGRFWVMLTAARAGVPLPQETAVTVSVWPIGSEQLTASESAVPDAADVSRRFAALVMDRERRYGVRAAIDGPLGPASVEAWVDATYDQRPQPMLLAVYLMPFALVGFLWLKMLVRRRRLSRARKDGQG